MSKLPPLNKCARTGKPIIELSHSGLATFASCPRKFAFRKAIVNFSNERSSSTAADVGTCLHETIQHYMTHHDVDAALEVLAMTHPIEISDNSKSHEYSLEATTITFLGMLDNGILNNYELATFIKDGKELPAVEIGFLIEIEFEHIMFHLRGLIDLVVRNPINNNFMALDIKTTTPQGSANMDIKYKFDYQTTSYGIPLQGLLGVDGDFDVAIMGVIQSDHTPSYPFIPFHRTQKDIDEYYYYLLDKCANIERYWVAERFPREPKGCMSWGRPCFYFSQCDVSTLGEMQMLVNPSGLPGHEQKPFPVVFTAQLDYKHG